MGISAWRPKAVRQVERVLFRGEAVRFLPGGPVRTLRPGRARGRLMGGNLTVLASLIGSPYMPDEDGLVLFLEEVGEPTSEVDRMLTQLAMAGILGRARALVFGHCTRCPAPLLDRTLTLERVLREHVRPLGIPSWMGAPIGHMDGQLTLPIGVEVEVDAGRGTIQLLEPAVA